MTNSGPHGTPPANQQAIEDGAELLWGMFAIADQLRSGSYDREAAIERAMRVQFEGMRQHGHARETYIDDYLVGTLDAVGGAYSDFTTAWHMGTCIAQLERACAAFDDAFAVIHGRA